MLRLRRKIIVSCLSLLIACRSNPFGDTGKTIEEFQLYTTDFTAQTDGGMKAALLDVIGGSKVTLNCAFSALTLTDVTEALVQRARAGVQVKIAFDGDVRTNDPGSLALQASGAFAIVTVPLDGNQSQLLYGNSGAGVMRHNYCLADERYIYLSTAPPDATQMTTTPNVAMRIGTPQFGLARDFLRESNMFSQLLFGNGKAKTDFTTKFTARDQVIGVFWGPQESPLNVLGVELSEATRRVDFYSTSFLTTNSSKADLDVPQTLQRLEQAKGIPLGKYFSSQALFDSASKAYTLNNPAQYVNSNVRIGANIFVVDRGLSSAKTFIYTGALRSQGNSSDDSVLVELRGKNIAEMVAAYLDRIGAVSVVASNTGDTSVAGAVVINEINWAGSYSNSLTSDTNDEFVEFYNTTGSAINLSGWGFICTTDGTAINGYFVLPAGAIIAPNGYFTVARANTGAFPNATFYSTMGSSGITNSSRQCKLTSGPATPGNANAPANYGAMPGTVIDVAGDATAAFDFSATANANITGQSTSLLRRSMERKFPIASGSLLTSWQTNVNSVAQNTQIDSQFNQSTFGTPGAATSVPVSSVALNRSLYFTTSNSHPNGIAKITAVSVASNTTIGTAETLNVRATSTSDAVGINLVLTETGTNTSTFTTTATGTHLNFTAGASAGNQLQVMSGDTVTLTLTESGTTYTATAQWYAQNLVINEIGSNCAAATANDYVEILNPNGQAVSLAGMTLYRDAGSSGTACTIGAGNFTSSIALSGTLAANGYALAGGSTYVAGGACPALNFTAASAVTIDASDCLALVMAGAGPATAADDEVVDFVGYGNATNPHEGAAVAADNAGGNNQCISRNPNATDTNVNSADFADQATLPCSPGGANGSLNVVSATTGNALVLQVTFNGPPNLAQAQSISNYCIALASASDCSSPALTVSAAVLSGSIVTLTTSTQSLGTAYKLYVTGVTLAATAQGILSGTANFTGAAVLPNLKINEVGVTSTGSNDFVEIYNAGASAVDLAASGIHIQRDSGCTLSNGVTGTHALTGTIAAGGYYVIAETGNTLANVNQTGLGNIASAYCVILTSSSTAATLPTSSNVIDWVTIAGAGDAENGVRAPDTGATGTISRIPNATDTDNNANDFALRAATPGLLNGTPTYSSTPASGATGIAIAANIVITFSESMNTAGGSVSVNGTVSGAQNSLACTWSMAVVANDRCTIDAPADLSGTGETVTVTLASFASQALALAPAPLTFQFTTVNVGLAPTVTNVVVASTNPDNGTTPYNTGTSTLTITGTNFTGATAVNLDDLNGAGAAVNSALTSVTVDSATQITATVPAGVRTNGSTGWNVKVTTPNGTNATSTVRFVPRAGILVSEVVQNGATGATSEFVELYNSTSLPIDIGATGINLRLHMRNSAGGNTHKALTSVTGVTRGDAGCAVNDTTIPSHGFYLVVSTGATTETWYAKRNATVTSGITGIGGVYISLSTTTDLLVIDKVGWSTVVAGSYEGTAAGTLAGSNSIERKPAGGFGHATDSDDNSSDFNLQSTTLTPRYCLDAVEP